MKEKSYTCGCYANGYSYYKTVLILFEMSNPFAAGIIKNDVISRFPAVRIPMEIAAPIVR
jgi:hypothetical protein